MNYTFALRFFAVMLTILSVVLATLVMRHDPVPLQSIIRIEVLRRAQWPSVMVRAGTVCLLVSFVLLLMLCDLLCD